MNKTDKKIETLCRRIIQHLEENPEAGDTLEGIAQWWLNEEPGDQLARALEDLVKKSKLRVYKTHSGTIYKRRSKKSDDKGG